MVLGKGRKYSKPAIADALADLQSRYGTLVFDYALGPTLVKSFEARLKHARDMGRDPQVFLEEEEREYRKLEQQALQKKHKTAMKEEAHRRRLAGETFADKVISEYHSKIGHYPALEIQPNADYEVSRLYGALDFLDKNHWTPLVTYLRKAFPGTGQLDRMAMEQRFWRFVSTRQGRMPEELESYRRALSMPSSSGKELIREAQGCIKQAAFFLHDFLELCEKARSKQPTNHETEQAIIYIKSLITDFRLKDLKRC